MMKSFSFILSVLLLASIIMLPVSANSAQESFVGTAANGAIIADGDSPIVVERELLTFDITDFPKTYYETVNEFLEYSSHVTAEYTFYNPADYSVKANLLFPLGHIPTYVPSYTYDEATGEKIYFDYSEGYGVKTNGNTVQATLRHSYGDRYSAFDYEQQLEILSDSDVSFGAVKRSSRVYKYTFISDNFPENENDLTFTITLPESEDSHILADPKYSFLDNSKNTLGFTVKEGEKFELYVIGKRIYELEDTSAWKAYRRGVIKDKNLVKAEFKLSEKEEQSFAELAMTEYDKSSGISEQDWYNGFVSYLKDLRVSKLYTNFARWRFDITDKLMCWYEYQIELAPGERITNEVSAPMYPDVDLSYTPDIYSYTYLASPAKSFTEFAELQVVINTPYSVVSSMTDIRYGGADVDIEKNDTGYRFLLKGLPDSEIRFTLSESESPICEKQGGIPIEIKIFIMECIGVAVVIGTVILIVVHKRRKARKLN